MILASVVAACAGSVVPADEQPSEPQHVFFLVSSLEIARLREPPRALFVRGRLESGRFVPEGVVEGEGELAREGSGTPGWVELANASFYSQATAKAPEPPYIEGELLANGLFIPYSREIH